MPISEASRVSTDPVYQNADSTLDADDFLKLFLTQLQNQDPTAPMDSSQMLEQTSQLTLMETQVEQQKAFEAITQSLQQSSTYQSQFALVSSIGKIAVTKNDGISISADTPNSNFNLFLKDPIIGGDIKIYNSTGNIIRTISLANYQNTKDEVGKDENGYDFKQTSGQFNFFWDGKDDAGNKVEVGTYTLDASLVAKDGSRYSSELGTYTIESVKFEKGQAYLKIGSKFVPFEDIKEIRQ
jgi:flagellar basal-body rod modification protein FlgD